MILDGMTVVNQLNKNMKVKTCKVSIVKHTKQYKMIIMQALNLRLHHGDFHCINIENIWNSC